MSYSGNGQRVTPVGFINQENMSYTLFLERQRLDLREQIGLLNKAFRTREPPMELVEEYSKILDRGSLSFIIQARGILDQDEKLLGLVNATHEIAEENHTIPFTYLDKVVTHPDARRRGIMTGMVTLSHRITTEGQLPHYTTWRASTNNPGAHRAYLGVSDVNVIGDKFFYYGKGFDPNSPEDMKAFEIICRHMGELPDTIKPVSLDKPVSLEKTLLVGHYS